jgi:hypothetical protein
MRNIALRSALTWSSSAILAVHALLSNDELASYGLTLDEYELIKSSESPNDFGGLSSDSDTDQLWKDAAAFSYQLAMDYATDENVSSLKFMPYVVCNVSPDTSGSVRREQISEAFNNTPSISVSDIYPYDAAIVNAENETCGIIRAFNDTVAEVYTANPGASEWMKIQPMHQSMKMINQTVEMFQERFDDTDAGSISAQQETDDTYVYRNVLGTQNILCPGVQDFQVEDVSDDEIVESIKNFLVADGGKEVKAASFYYQRVNIGEDKVHTESMTKWANVIAKVDSFTDAEDGTNACLDKMIDENMIFDLNKLSLDVYARVTMGDVFKFGETLGLVQNDVEACMLYLVMGLALNPLICSVEPEPRVMTFCKDGSSDLMKCPPESSAGTSITKGTFRRVVMVPSVVLAVVNFI